MRLTRRAVTVRLFFAVFLVYCAVANGYIDVADGDVSYRVARSLALHGTVEVSTQGDEPPPGPISPIRPGGKAYATFGLGAALEFVPSVWLGYVLPVSRHLRDEAARALASFTHPLWGAATVAGVYLVATGLGYSALAGLGASLSLALASPWWFHSKSSHSEVAQGAALCFAVLLLHGLDDASDRRQRLWLASGGALLLAALVLLKVANAPAACVLIGVVAISAIRRRSPDRWATLGLLALGVLGALVIVGAYNHARFGSVLETGYGAVAAGFTLAAVPQNLVRYLVDPRRGLLVFAPLLVLGAFGYVTMGMSARQRAWRKLALAGGLFLALPYFLWPYGTPDFYGVRFLVPLLPLLAVGLAGVLDLPALRAPRRIGRLGIAVLVAWSLSTEVVGVLVSPSEFQYLAWRSLGTGELPASFPNWQAAWVLAVSKARGRPEVYPPQTFGLPPGRPVDLSMYESFQGFNVWSAHAARQLHLPWIRLAGWIPALLGLAMIGRVLARDGPVTVKPDT